MIKGLRPEKPENASSIGFSDSLWDLTKRCWDGDSALRPGVAEIVTHLEREAEEWDRRTQFRAPVENTPSYSVEPTSDTLEHREFAILILLDHRSPGIGTDGSSPSVPDHPTEPQATSGSTASSLPTEPPQEETPVFSTDPSKVQRSEPQVSAQPRSEDPHVLEIFPQLDQHHHPPPSQLQREGRRARNPFKLKFRQFFER